MISLRFELRHLENYTQEYIKLRTIEIGFYFHAGNCSRGYRTIRCDDTINIETVLLSSDIDAFQCKSPSCVRRRVDFYRSLFHRSHNLALSEECWIGMICWASDPLRDVSILSILCLSNFEMNFLSMIILCFCLRLIAATQDRSMNFA